MADRSGGLLPQPSSKQATEGEEASRPIVLRDFGGVNLQSPRDAINDNDFYWLEELIPVGAGNLKPTLGPGLSIIALAENGAPTCSTPFQMNGTDYLLAIWANSGNAWVGKFDGTGWVKIASTKFTSGKTAATPWSNLGVLIVDPTAGYYDYNVTTANTLTNLTGQLYSPAVSSLNPPVLQSSTVPPLRITDATGTGGTIDASASVVSAVVQTAGTGYSPGDVLIASGGTLTTDSHAPVSQQNQATVITVTSVGAGGAITGISITNPGYYQVGPSNHVTMNGGTGTGAKLDFSWSVGSPFIVTPGSGYTSPNVQYNNGSSWLPYSMTVQTSGTLQGTAIAVYASRVWIAIGRVVQYTDAGSYNSFGNSGGAFTIDDAYLHGGITALFAANSYLYIFGPESVDILSNVQVVNGIAQFSRVNASASVGTTQPNSIFSFLRSLAFCSSSGYYVMSGATPDKISDNLNDFISEVNFGIPVWGGQVIVQNILCVAFLVTFNDVFITNTQRSILCLKFRNRWWFTSQLPASMVGLSAMVSIPVNGLATLYGWSGATLYPLLAASNINNWTFKTKLWDGGAVLFDKQAIKVGIAVDMAEADTGALALDVDTEYASFPVTFTLPLITWINNSGVVTQWVNNGAAVVSWQKSPSGYTFFFGTSNAAGGKYLGITGQGSSNSVDRTHFMALDFERRRAW